MVYRSEVRGRAKGGQREYLNVQDSFEFTFDEMGKNHVIHIPKPAMSGGSGDE